MRLGFTTLTQSQKCRASNRSYLVRPLLRNLRGFEQGRWHKSFGRVKGRSWARPLDKRCILCRRIEAATPWNRKNEARKTGSRCSALAGQRPCLHVTSCHDCCDWMCIWTPSSSPIFSCYGPFWPLSVPKTEIPSLWYTIWEQWGIRKLEQR